MEINHLNDKDVAGNHLLLTEEEPDLYHCSECEKDVPEDEWNGKQRMCYSCWWSI